MTTDRKPPTPAAGASAGWNARTARWAASRETGTQSLGRSLRQSFALLFAPAKAPAPPGGRRG